MNEQEQRQIFDGWLQEHKGILFKIVRAYAFTPYDQDDLFQGRAEPEKPGQSHTCGTYSTLSTLRAVACFAAIRTG